MKTPIIVHPGSRPSWVSKETENKVQLISFQGFGAPFFSQNYIKYQQILNGFIMAFDSIFSISFCFGIL